ncbi:MAG: hypothetical protein NZV14_18410 [Bryobacteraceae bacterium]|nr:hypothetical protein [Bryobacteraceae bacterium]MDW8380140.1 hypothetical protein [Bryobacterales bacterium]
MTDAFGRLLQAQALGGATAVLDCLIEIFRERGEFNRMFEARLMRQRHELGLPLIPETTPEELGQARQAYQDALLAAARDTAMLYLNAGQIAEAWPYFRALGQTSEIRQAIEQLGDAEGDDAVMEIALQEGVHPAKGFAMLLKRHGICRALTFFEQYPDLATREASLALLSRTLHSELDANLRAAIEALEGTAPEGNNIPQLIANRDWLFGEYSAHLDVAHLMSIVRFCWESSDPDTLARGLEMAEYGSRLHATVSYRGDPPFEDFFRDATIYLRARTGVDVEAAVAHFRAKVASYDLEEIGSYPVQTFIRMLLRLNRPAVAVEVFEQFLSDVNPAYLSCPSLPQLCRLAGDFERLKMIAQRDGDLIQYVAAILAQETALGRTANS